MAWINALKLEHFSKIQINYLFFGLYFLLVSFIHVYHVLLIDSAWTLSQFYFLINVLGQCLLETLLLIFIGHLIRHLFGVIGTYAYSFLLFTLLLAHFVDFPLVRFMDMSVWYALDFITKESSQNFLEILYASNVSLLTWICSFLIGLAVLFSGLLFYRATEKIIKRRPWIVSLKAFLFSTAGLGIGVLAWDIWMQNFVQKDTLHFYVKALPWKRTLIPSDQEAIAYASRPPKRLFGLSKKEITPEIELEKQPDIFLFVIESLREDFINEVNAPHLWQFKQQNTSFELALSNANATHLSWYSLFYSQSPMNWGKDSSQACGSPSLKMLKEMGYSVHAFSSARLSYYNMQEILFGSQNCLADQVVVFEKGEPHERDREAIEALIDELQHKPKGGRFFVTFLDSTHLDYSWPTDQSAFHPYEEKINYLKVAFTRDVEAIKNRYRNSLYYVDSLLAKFFEALAASEGGDEAMVVVTSDHGEEFYEYGRLFHASHLSQQQMHVPLYYRFGKSRLQTDFLETKMSCHMDIFPTIFHCLANENICKESFQGQSIFEPDRWPYTMIGRYNASSQPFEICVHNGRQKMIAQLQEGRKGSQLKIIDLRDLKDQSLPSHELINFKSFLVD